MFDFLQALDIPESLAVAIFTAASVLMLISIFGGKEISIKELKIGHVGFWNRLISGMLGLLLAVVSISSFIEYESFKNHTKIETTPPVSPGTAVSESLVSKTGIIPPVSKDEHIHDDHDAALRKYINLKGEFADDIIENEKLRKQFEVLGKNQSIYLEPSDIQDINKIIESLTASIDSFKELEEKDKSNTLTVTEKLRMWDNPKIERLSVRDRGKIKKQINKYKAMIAEWASIKNPEKNFITCRDVKNRNPVRPSNQFNKKVFIWARVNAPRTENLRFQWWDPTDNKVLKTVYPVKVKKNVGDGFRTYYSKNINKAGIYEVRLFNSQDQLIGRREFQVGPLTSKSF